MSGFPQTFISPLDSVRATTEATDKLGTIRVELNKIYKYCALKLVPTADVDAVIGDMLVYTSFALNEVGIDIDDQENEAGAAGIAVATIDMSVDKGKLIWVQIKGPATLTSTVANSAAAGNGISGTGTGSADKTFTLMTTLKEHVGHLINSTNKTVFLDCPY